MEMTMSEQDNTSSSSLPALQVHALFERFKLKTVGAIGAVFVMLIGGPIFSILPLSIARLIHLVLLLLVIAFTTWICRKDWKVYIQYRQSVIDKLTPGWYSVGVGGWVKRSPLDFDKIMTSGETEIVSKCEQGGLRAKLADAADIGVFLFALLMFNPIVSTSTPPVVDIYFAPWALLIAIAVKWVVWGNAFFAGVNRLEVDPQGWQWGGWSKRIMKQGRWEDARVLIKPMTKWGRDRYFVVIGDDDCSIGMIVPKASVELIERAMATRH
jgi:hypothetical protein